MEPNCLTPIIIVQFGSAFTLELIILKILLDNLR